MDTITHGGKRPGAGRPKAVTSDAVKRIRQALPTTGKVETGWSQDKMARELGCTLYALGDMERKKRLPTDAGVLIKLRRLAKTANVEVPELQAIPRDNSEGK